MIGKVTVTSSARKWLIGGGVVVALLVALLVVPALIDVNAYKAEIVARVKRETGQDLVIAGPISLWLLPTPAVRADGIKLVNSTTGTAPFVEIKSVTVRPSLLALLVGQVKIAEVRAVEPKAFLEVDAQGKPNFPMPTVAEEDRALSLARITVEDGAVVFNDVRAGLSISVEKGNIEASAASVDGPFSVSGGATVNGVPLRFELDLGAKGPSGHAADIALQAGDGRLSLKGTLSELAPAARLSGKASASATNLVAFAQTLFKIAGLPHPPLPPLLAGKFSFEGPVELSQTALASKDFKLILGDDEGLGSAAITLQPALNIDAKFAAKRLDLDRWLASIKLPDEAPAPEPPPPLDSAATPPVAAGPSLLLSTTAKLNLEVGELIYNKQPVRDIAADLDARGGAVAVPRFYAVLPGNLAIKAQSTMSGDPARPSVSGDFSLIGGKLRETLTWLGVDVAAVPADKLSRVSMTGRLTSNSGNVEVKDAAFELDDLTGRGGILVAFTLPLAVVTHLEFDTVDLDSYLPPAGRRSSVGPGPRTSSIPILALLGPMVGLKLKIGELTFRDESIAGVELDVARERGILKLNDLKFASLAGARLALRGNIAGYWEQQPRADVAFSFDAPDMNRVLKLVDAAQQGLGAVSARGSLAGTFEQLVLREVAVSAMGVSATVTGTLALPGAAQGMPSSASYKGSITVNGQTIEGSVQANLTGKPNIAADLKAGMIDLDRIAASQGKAAASSPPIDTAPLRHVDGTFRLSAAGLKSGPLRVTDLDMAAGLKDGVLTFSTLKGSLYGGTLDLSGTVNGTQPALSFDVKGSAQGMHVGELLRAASGANVFGRIINVTIDGSLNADDIALRGQGPTVAQIKSSLAGGARLSGYVRPSADRFLQILGSAATGAVGGAIDITLGNLMSLGGDKGGVDIANLLNAISLVLHRYVNHDNALSGQIDVAGGILTANGLTVQASNAKASVTTQTNLANATTQTTITFVIAEDQSAPYLITTASGPLSALSFHATRGSAKDPPGIEKMVPNVGRLLPKIPMPHIPVPSIPNPFGR